MLDVDWSHQAIWQILCHEIIECFSELFATVEPLEILRFIRVSSPFSLISMSAGETMTGQSRQSI